MNRSTSIPAWLKRRIPALDWLASYELKHLRGDALAGVIVATLLIPQAMAYALLAGLPPQVGLYASLLPLFHHLPQAVLAAIIIVAVASLMDFAMPRRLWHYNKADAAALILTFVAVLALGVEQGILIGVGATILLYLWRTSRPHMAVVGRVPDTEHFRNVRRHQVQTLPHVLLLRIDESLYFANAKYIEDFVLRAAAERPQLRHLVLICNAINFIDASALETLTDLRARIEDAGIELYLSEVKGPVMDRLAGLLHHARR